MSEAAAILYMDKEWNNLNIFRAHFRLKGYQIYITTTEEEAASILQTHEVHLLIVDQPAVWKTGIEFLTGLSMKLTNPVVISVTAHRDSSLVDQIYKEGRIFCYHHKPWNLEDLELSIEKAIENYRYK